MSVTWQLVGHVLTGIAAIFAAIAFIVGISKAPLGIGLSALWSRIDTLRNSGMLAFGVAEFSSRLFFGLSVITGVCIAVGTIVLALLPYQLMDLVVRSLPQAQASRFDVAAVAVLARDMVMPVAVVAPVAFALKRFDGEGFSKYAGGIVGWALVVWLVVLWSNGGFTFYAETLPAITREYFSSYALIPAAGIAGYLLTIIALAAAPLALVLYIFPSLGNLEEYDFDSAPHAYAVFFAGLITSFAVSILAVCLGAHVQREHELAISVQLLASNAVFDGLTWGVTSALLGAVALPLRAARDAKKFLACCSELRWSRRWRSANYSMLLRLKERYEVFDKSVWDDSGAWGLVANGDAELTDKEFISSRDAIVESLERLAVSSRWRLWPALICDLLCAAVFSYGSVYFGYLGTSQDFTLGQLNALFFGGFDGAHFTELGPLFWLMHSSFLPTVLLWCILLTAAFAGFVISPFGNWLMKVGNRKKAQKLVLSRAEQARKALVKTGAFFGGLSGIVNALLFVGWLK